MRQSEIDKHFIAIHNSDLDLEELQLLHGMIDFLIVSEKIRLEKLDQKREDMQIYEEDMEEDHTDLESRFEALMDSTDRDFADMVTVRITQ